MSMIAKSGSARRNVQPWNEQHRKLRQKIEEETAAATKRTLCAPIYRPGQTSAPLPLCGLPRLETYPSRWIRIPCIWFAQSTWYCRSPTCASRSPHHRPMGQTSFASSLGILMLGECYSSQKSYDAAVSCLFNVTL